MVVSKLFVISRSKLSVFPVVFAYSLTEVPALRSRHASERAGAIWPGAVWQA